MTRLKNSHRASSDKSSICTVCHCQCRGSQTLSTTSSGSCQSWIGLELLNRGATALIGRDGVCACARACMWEELVAPG